MHAVVPTEWECNLRGEMTVCRRNSGLPALEEVREALSTGERNFLICAEGVAPEPGWLLATDHISLFGDSPLTGPNRDDLGSRFSSLSGLYRTPYGCWNRGVVCRVPDWRSATRAELLFSGAAALVSSGIEEAVVAGHGGGSVVLLVKCHGFDGRSPGSSPLDALLLSISSGH
jgi:hypothetical protein